MREERGGRGLGRQAARGLSSSEASGWEPSTEGPIKDAQGSQTSPLAAALGRAPLPSRTFLGPYPSPSLEAGVCGPHGIPRRGSRVCPPRGQVRLAPP